MIRRVQTFGRVLFVTVAAVAIAALVFLAVPRSAVPAPAVLAPAAKAAAKAARRQDALPLEAAPSLDLFTAPSHLPSGQRWILVGTSKDLPEDLAFDGARSGTSVVEVERLSARAMAVLLDVPPGAAGRLLDATSARDGTAAELAVERGQAVPELSEAVNFTSDDLVDGKVVVMTPHFLYGYRPATDGGIGAVRIHNRRTGVWARREILIERELERARTEADLADLPEAFVVVDERETMPDSDGDGVPDFDDDPEPQPERPDYLGVALETGDNLLDVLSFDEHGNASWKTITVLSTYDPPPEDQ